MKKKVNNKKGFTLAELLVVLAILAVLVAVAIPLFTGAISTAEKTAKDANVRAIRAAGVVEILTAKPTPTEGTNGWYATATVGTDGEMSGLTISACNDTTPSVTYPAGGTVNGEYKVPVNDVK